MKPGDKVIIEVNAFWQEVDVFKRGIDIDNEQVEFEIAEIVDWFGCGDAIKVYLDGSPVYFYERHVVKNPKHFCQLPNVCKGTSLVHQSFVDNGEMVDFEEKVFNRRLSTTR